ncbi:MAG: DMT family transporter [Thermoplasmata archaeon]
MAETWLLLAIVAILMYGSSMVIQKKSLHELSVPSMILFSLLVAFPMFVIVLIYEILTGELSNIAIDGVVLGLLGATFGQIGYYAYVEAAKRGPISIVGSATATYPVMVVIVAIIFLGEFLTTAQGIGVIIIMISMVTLSYTHESSEDSKHASQGYYAIVIFTVLAWGLWAIFTKLALLQISDFAFLGLYSFVVPPITLIYYRLKRVQIRDAWPKWGFAVKLAVISAIVGNLAFFVEIMAVEVGPAAIVFPLIASAPVVVAILAFLFLRERLSRIEWLLVAGFIIGIILVSTI